MFFMALFQMHFMALSQMYLYPPLFYFLPFVVPSWKAKTLFIVPNSAMTFFPNVLCCVILTGKISMDLDGYCYNHILTSIVLPLTCGGL